MKFIQFSRFFFIVTLVFFTAIPGKSAIAAEIRVNKIEGAKEQLIFSILKLVVEKNSSDNQITQRKQEVPVARLVEETLAKEIDVMWAGSSSVLDDKLRAVRIPLLKGLLGHRIFIIRDGVQNKFNNINNLNELGRLKAGMGHFWGSTKVLRNAGLPVVTSVKYENLFHMLDGSRFDYFPRAVHEPWSEVSNHPDLPLTVEKRLLLIYPYAMYFYIRKDNEALYNLLATGLEAAIADGSFDELFFSSPMIKAALQQTEFSQRIVMRIDNPDMHPDTPISRPELWLNVSEL